MTRKLVLCMVGSSRDSVPHLKSVRDALASEGIPRDIEQIRKASPYLREWLMEARP